MTTARRSTVLLTLGLLFTSCAPDAISSEGERVGDLYRFFMYFAAAVFILVTGLITWSIIRFRDRSTDESLPKQFAHNMPLEVLWFAIPTVIVIVLFFTSFGVLNDVNEENAEGGNNGPPIVLEVEGFRWGWRFTWPEWGSIESLPDDPAEIYLPVGRDITFELSSNDVIHSFWVPRFLLKRDVVPGRDNRIDLTLTEEGTFDGKCAEFCGLLHDRMDFTLKVVPEAEYEDWFNEQFPLLQQRNEGLTNEESS
jgi:cytochrome c oxidase subunit 2